MGKVKDFKFGRLIIRHTNQKCKMRSKWAWPRSCDLLL